jgi:hypothetical protein
MRKEVNLDAKTIKALEKLAKTDNRKLKPYMEKVLIEHADKNSNPKKASL